jgi:hypothetical protein
VVDDNLDRTGAVFTTTRWSLVGELCSEDHDARRAAASALARRYWPAVYAYLRRRGLGREPAAETTQGFFADVVLGRALLEGADPSRGKLRSLVLTALQNYVADVRRHEGARRRAETVAVLPQQRLADEERLLEHSVSAQDAPDAAFYRRWWSVVVEEAQRRCRVHFCSTGKRAHWDAYEAHVLLPATTGLRPAPYSELGPRLGFRTPADAAAAVDYLKKRLRELIREVIAETLGEAESVEDELSAMRESLG